MSRLEHSNKKRIITIAAEGDYAQDVERFIRQLDNVGYEVKRRSSILEQPSSDADLEIIVTDFSDAYDNELKIFQELRSSRAQVQPLIFISPHGEFRERHKAVKFGGSAFLLTKNNDAQLLDKLDTLLTQDYNDFNVLLVDDDEDLAEHYALTLEQNNINTTIAHRSEEALDILQRKSIDLVLLDLNMPDCDGFEFASILRQLNDYISLPIIFISTQHSINKVKSRNNLGADDFLTKPVSDKQLINTVTYRAARAQVLQKIMQRDSATQLLNHSTLKKELALEVMRAKRRRTNFSYALLDLDHFKSVNDTFGHAAGDEVIKVLAHMLRSSLRTTDVIGRYGGEEFGVILLDKSADEAKDVINRILKKFSVTPFKHEEKEFFVTFSAGIADFITFNDPTTLSKAADDALYIAKEAGRKQACIAQKESISKQH